MLGADTDKKGLMFMWFMCEMGDLLINELSRRVLVLTYI